MNLEEEEAKASAVVAANHPTVHRDVLASSGFLAVAAQALQMLRRDQADKAPEEGESVIWLEHVWMWNFKLMDPPYCCPAARGPGTKRFFNPFRC